MEAADEDYRLQVYADNPGHLLSNLSFVLTAFTENSFHFCYEVKMYFEKTRRIYVFAKCFVVD